MHCNNHTTSFRHRHYINDAAVSEYAWKMKTSEYARALEDEDMDYSIHTGKSKVSQMRVSRFTTFAQMKSSKSCLQVTKSISVHISLPVVTALNSQMGPKRNAVVKEFSLPHDDRPATRTRATFKAVMQL